MVRSASRSVEMHLGKDLAGNLVVVEEKRRVTGRPNQESRG